MKKFMLFIYLCVGLSCVCYAQQPDTLPAPSPDVISPLAASTDGTTGIPETTWAERLASQSNENSTFIRRINTPTDRYTGVVDVQVPIYEMDNYIGKLPITLHYLTTGLRVKDASSDVGLGWELSAGGKITRVVRGQPDNFEQLKLTSDLSAWDKGFFEWYTSKEWDTEPDLYYYEVPGLSGCFVFDGDGTAHTIPEQHIKIEHLGTGKIIIYAQDGTRYYMNQSTPNTWHLWRLVYPDNSVVAFDYKHLSRNVHELTNYITTVESRPNTIPRIVKSEKIEVPVLTNAVQLQSITYKESRIDFVYDYIYTDTRIDSCYWCLKQIDVLWNKTPYRQFQFEYDTLSRTKFKLLSIREKRDRSKEVRPLYRFDYYADTLPRTSYMGIDRWGYCNSRQKSPVVCPGVDIGDFSTVVIGASRKPDLLLTRAQSLRKISYPNGGSKEFLYELHRGVNPRTGREEDAGGLRIRKIVERSSDNATPSIRRYEYGGGAWVNDIDNFLLERNYYPTSSFKPEGMYHYKLSSYPVNPTTDLYGSSVVYSDVREYLPNGSSIHYHYVPLSDLQDVLPDKYLITDVGAVYAGKETDGRTPKSTRAWGRNLLQSRKLFDAGGRLVGHEAFRYRLDTAGAVRIPAYRMYTDTEERLMDGYNQTYAERCYYVGRYEWVCCNALLTERIVYASDTELPRRILYGYSSNGLLRKVLDRDAQGTLTTQTFRYAEDFIRRDTVLNALIYNNYLRPIEQVAYRNGKVLSASLNTFTLRESIIPKGVTILQEAEYALKRAPTDSTSFQPVRTDATGNLVYDRNAYELVRSNHYDFWNRLCCYRDEQGQYHSIVFNHIDKTYPVASVTGAYHGDRLAGNNEVYFNDFEDYTPQYEITIPDAVSGTKAVQGMRYLPELGLKDGAYKLTYWYRTCADPQWKRRQAYITLPEDAHYEFPDFIDHMQIDDLSVIPCNATLESEVRIGPLGTVSQTDARGRVRYYRYNSVGLLVEVSDELGRILKKYTYDPNYIKL